MCATPAAPAVPGQGRLIPRAVLDVRRAAALAAEAAPRRPEDHREDEPEGADDHQDHADRLQLEALHRGVDRPGEDGADCDEKDAHSKTHSEPPVSGGCVLRGPGMSGSVGKRSRHGIGYGLCRLAAVRRGSIVRITIYGVLAGVLASLVAVLVPWLPTSASEEMDRIEFTFWFTTVICIGVFAVVAAAIVYSVLKFRVQPEDDSDGPPIHGHTGLEIVWTAIPAVLVTAISIVSAIVLAKNDDAGPNPIRIAVTAQQFAWEFEYPGESKVTSGQLVLPVDRAVKLTLRSLDVIHSFWVPEFGQKSDAVPGIETTLVITPTRIGSYSLVCTELCGLGHATMRAQVRVVEQAEYEEFLAGAGDAPGSDENSGEAVFTTAGCGGPHPFA